MYVHFCYGEPSYCTLNSDYLVQVELFCRFTSIFVNWNDEYLICISRLDYCCAGHLSWLCQTLMSWLTQNWKFGVTLTIAMNECGRLICDVCKILLLFELEVCIRNLMMGIECEYVMHGSCSGFGNILVVDSTVFICTHDLHIFLYIPAIFHVLCKIDGTNSSCQVLKHLPGTEMFEKRCDFPDFSIVNLLLMDLCQLSHLFQFTYCDFLFELILIEFQIGSILPRHCSEYK